MEGNLNARVLGAVVTILAMALVLPNILQEKSLHDPLRTEIPPKPQTPEWVGQADSTRVRIELDALVGGSFEEEITAPEPRIVTKDDPKRLHDAGKLGSLDQSGAAVSWTLQVGAFKAGKNAISFRDKLRAKGFKAYILKNGDGTLDRVYVGPMIQRSKAEQAKIKLLEEMSIKGIRLQQYKPE
jgi:DedD protein